MGIKSVIKKIIIQRNGSKKKLNSEYLKKYDKYSFRGTNCTNVQQYEAVITRLYHSIEKGLSYQNYRVGFGKANIEALLSTLEKYSSEMKDYDVFFYRTALSTLFEYIKKNKEHGHFDENLEQRVKALPGNPNILGGIIKFEPLTEENVQKLNFNDFLKDRHSIRHFSGVPVDVEKLKAAVRLAQYTPSACNRQGWRTRIIANKDLLNKVLSNQNGNTGFGQEIDKLLIVTTDIRYFNRDRETYQAFIDGGMYAENLINALHFYHIGSIPLSASLTKEQETNVRDFIGMDDAEVLILFIGVGSYPEQCQTTRSERRDAEITVL
ncbi:MAG: nitroreductase family protein [Clostridia bacterium]|nr:nitroreductase family protein [Clostridia bacterium]